MPALSFGFVILCVSIAAAQPVSDDRLVAAPTVDELVQRLTTSSRALFHLRVQFESWVETRARPTDPWKASEFERRTGTAWYDGIAYGKARLSFDQEILKWENGPAPASEHAYEMGFDGVQGRQVQHRQGPPGKTRPEKTAQILADRPPALWEERTGYVTGAGHTLLLGHLSRDNRPFIQSLAEAISKGRKPQVSIEPFRDCPAAIKLLAGDHRAIYWCAWLDPAREYALIGARRGGIDREGRQVIQHEDVVTRLQEVAPGVWYPTEAYHEVRDWARNDVDRRLYYRCKSLVANDASFDENVFQVPLPKDYEVEDRMRGTTYVVGAATDPAKP